MVYSIISKTCSKHAQLETLMFHCGWCLARTMNITMDSSLSWHFCYTFICLGFVLGWQMHTTFYNVLFLWIKDCMKSRSCLNFPLCLAWVESMVIMVYGENQRYGNEVWNTQLHSHGDVNVHQPRKNHWIFQSTWEIKGGGELW
jgi:hypothetical protein